MKKLGTLVLALVLVGMVCGAATAAGSSSRDGSWAIAKPTGG